MDKLVTGQGLQQSLKILIQQETKPPILIQDTPGFWLKIYLRMYLNNLMAHFIVLQVANFVVKAQKSNLLVLPATYEFNLAETFEVSYCVLFKCVQWKYSNYTVNIEVY